MAKSSNHLKIIGYKDDSFKSKVGEFSVRYNPTRIDHRYSICFDEKQAVGSSASENKYKNSKPEEISFDLIFDNTFIAEDDSNQFDVGKALKEFKKLVIEFNGDIHRPNYLSLEWGELLFKGQVKDASFTYTAFTADGKPLKATAKLTFVGVLNIDERLAKENKSSPDLTHIITIKEGDTLPGLCYQIYSNPAYYLKVAKINKIDNFRKLKAGSQVILPPLQR